MASQVTLQAKGLNIQPNPLSVPQGSLLTAKNVIIRRDDVVESRRGFKLWGNSFGSVNDRVKQLFTYKNRILRHYASTLQYDSTGEGDFLSFSGPIVETETGLRIKSLESNGNLYLTTNQGIKKIAASSPNDFTTDSGFITDAGGIKAIDVSAALNIVPGDSSGFLPANSAVAYRVVWAIKDINNNLIVGSPSPRAVVYNPLLGLMIPDYQRMLYALDNLATGTTLITDANYISTLSLNANSSASDLQTNLQALASKLDTDILYTGPLTVTLVGSSVAAGVATLKFSGSPVLLNYFAVGQKINLTGFTTTTGTINGSQTITAIDDTADTISFSTTAATLTAVGNIESYIFRNINATTVVDQTSSLDALILNEPPTAGQLGDIQITLQRFFTALQALPSGVVDSTTSNLYLQPLDITNSANVKLTISIPSAITSNHFYQVYRSDITIATGVGILSDLTPNDEMRLVYEAYPTAAELSALSISLVDVTSDSFRGANLYTNSFSGEGISQANDIPPLAKDINRFKNSSFYANTKTKQRLTIGLLGVSQIIEDYDNSLNPRLVISDGTTTNIYKFVTGRAEVTNITFPAESANNYLNGSYGSYFSLNTGNDQFQYLFYYVTSGVGLEPNASGTITSVATGGVPTITSASHGLQTGDKITISGSNCTPSIDGVHFVTRTGANTFTIPFAVTGAGTLGSWTRASTSVRINISTAEAANSIAQKTRDAINSTVGFFTAEDATLPTIEITNYTDGYCTDASLGGGGQSMPAGTSLSITQQGRGENVATKEVLLSQVVSPAQAVDETAKSLINVINKNNSENIYGYYISSTTSVPGQMVLEARNLNTNPFYVLGSSLKVGSSFNPDVSPTNSPTITAINTSTDVITTSNVHGLKLNEKIIVLSTGTAPTPDISGLQTITQVVSTTEFKIGVDFTISGSGTAVYQQAALATFSTNEEQRHRVYYSKRDQPEAVPIINYYDVGASDKAILRIFPLRDSLFVFKEDGLYRISGESIPFTLALFDSSCILLAPDSVSVANNVIYCWTTQGIATVSEAGVSIISRPIDTEILLLQSAQYTNFKTATWGLGYESDNSYLVWTVSNKNDTLATQAYRYSNLTNSWTTYTKTNTAGVLNTVDDKIYLGAGDINYIEQERKNFDRYDYADREIDSTLTAGSYLNNILKLANVSSISIGDSVVQEQLLTVYEFNNLLQKLDIDPGVGFTDYFATLKANPGDSLRNKIVALAQKLDTDPGVNQTDFFSSIQTLALVAINTSSVGNPTVINSPSHGLITGRVISINGHTGSTPAISGTYEVTVVDSNNFTIPVNVLVSGTGGTFNTLDTNFEDIKACYNKIIQKLNVDSSVVFSNYSDIDTTTSMEAVVIAVNPLSKQVTLNLTLQYVQGPITIYKAIDSEITYAPETMGDPLSLKQIREATMMFVDKAFTSATLVFSTDLIPGEVKVPFNASGNGIFGHSQFFGTGFFGGASHAAPFRTYIPRDCQRCRYMLVKFNHKVAREKYSILGVTLTASDSTSTRAYR